MLKRQQAQAIVAARSQIVEGAVGMVKMALEELEKQGVVELDEERKANKEQKSHPPGTISTKSSD